MVDLNQKQKELFARKELSPADKWDRDSARRALDDLFNNARQYKSSAEFRRLIDFIARFRFYSPFNAMLIHTQMRGAKFVASAHRWSRDYLRRIKAGARPIAILRPMGPIMFVFDVVDTDPMPGAPPLPSKVDRPFEVRHGRIGNELPTTIENSKRDGVSVIEREAGSQSAGSIQCTARGAYLEVMIRRTPKPEFVRVPRRYALILNSNLSIESRYATLVHELAHLYCGHLGTPDPKWWPDRQGLGLTVREFEAESVCYLVCERAGLSSTSSEYLADYLKENEEIPAISFDRVMKATGLIEEMARKKLLLRKPGGGKSSKAKMRLRASKAIQKQKEDEETWAEAKPMFIEAAQEFRLAAKDIGLLAVRLTRKLQDVYGLSVDAIEEMRPYLNRFIKEVRNGTIKVATPESKQAQ